MTVAQAAGRTWFGHPPGLAVLALTETWDAFSFYGMRTLLVYYMVGQLSMPQAKASLIYGLYTGFLYFTPILGGLIADRWLGPRKAVIVGALFMAAGHFMMAFEPLLYVALISIVIGNGFFLPSLSSQIRLLYAAGDARQPRAYSVYYMGINIGGFFAPLVCGTVGELYGWHYGFALAGFGMLTGLAVYLGGGRYLPADPGRRRPQAPRMAAADRADMLRPLIVLGGVTLVMVLVRGVYEQLGNTLALWTDTGVDRALGGFTIPMTWFQSINPLVIILGTPVILSVWARAAARGKELSSVAKMSLGAVIFAAAFLALAGLGAWLDGERAHWSLLALFIIAMTVGELYIFPVGLSLFGRLAPEKLSAFTIAIWFSSAFAGNLLAGLLGTLWSRLPPEQFFAILAAVALLGAALLLLFRDRIANLEAELKR